MPRLFLAVQPDGLANQRELKQLLGKLKRTTHERGDDVRWTPPELWHITLHFFGEVGADETVRLIARLEAWRPAGWSEVNLRLQVLGAFPTPDHARVLWLGVQASQGFLHLRHDVVNASAVGASSISDSSTEPDYHPHLTLARFRNPTSVTDLIGLGGRKFFGDYKIKQLILFESVLQGNSVKYIPRLRKELS